MTVPTIMRIRSARPVAVALSAAVIIVVSASATIAVPDSTSSQGGAGQWVEQIGTYDSLVSPDYDGLTPISAASSGATLGLGTFDQLDGEMVLVGGVIYRVGTDGIPVKVPSSRTTPFFEGIRFKPEVSGPVAPGTTCANLLAAVNALASSDSGIVAVRARGTFTDLVTRSVGGSNSASERPCSSDSGRHPTSQALELLDCTCMGSRPTDRPAATCSRASQVRTFNYRCSGLMVSASARPSTNLSSIGGVARHAAATTPAPGCRTAG